ncbi:MAG: hypothetical protein HN704_13510 [Bacteroidetes bacterium]|jgi:hypothetical protein|nr:hypothetical protein [Bacteroidota bacterium]MBT6684704.1 hypothetical protein [Bacteroidota bacterium]MBT7143171.1 hypothetical protein [Bacteroidota bacterium]MBT7492614.1 hypothetical protein [Bacteroidota bacterium]
MNEIINKTLLISAILFTIILHNSYGQSNGELSDSTNLETSQTIDVYQFNYKILAQAMLDELNKNRDENGVDRFVEEKILTYTAKEQAENMAKDQDVRRDPMEICDIALDYDGTNKIAGLTEKSSLKKSGEYYTYQFVANYIVDKWMRSPKTASRVTDYKYIFVGIGSSLDDLNKKVYVSVVFGNYYSKSPGIDLANELEVPITTKSMGLKGYNQKICEKLDKFRGLSDLQESLFVEDDMVYFKHYDLKELKKIIKKDSYDGIAVDIIQKEQYPCNAENALDNNLYNKGILLDKLLAKKLYSSNLIEGKDAKKNLMVEIDYMPQDIGEYELNLILIKDKHICRNIQQAFVFNGNNPKTEKIEILADTVSSQNEMVYVPETKSRELSFKIIFEKGKYEYTNEDINPYFEELNQPPFIIDKLHVVAYSSIENTDPKNIIKQHKRAESIKNIIAAKQNEEPEIDLLAKDSWSLFKIDVIGTEFEHFASMTLQQAKSYIRKNDMYKDLEPILKNHRFARVEMQISYDLRGEKEQEFVLFQFNRAIKKQNLPLALSIQKYILKKIIAGKYNSKAIHDQEIPLDIKFTGMIMNKLWMQNFVNEIESEQFYKEMQDLYKLAPTNGYISFNNIFSKLENEQLTDDYQAFKIQSQIEKLYRTTLDKKTIDLLNLEFQFKIIEEIDTVETTNPLVVESLNRIKNLVNIKESSWQSSLKLAHIFIDHNDYEYAASLLDPFIENENVNEELLFTYISLCSHETDLQVSSKFVNALRTADKINHKRYCSLFDGKHFSIQVFENPSVKSDYCKKCR